MTIGPETHALIWFQRADGLWNADCACGAACCGVVFDRRRDFETWHFEKAIVERARGERALECGPKFPEVDINHPEPFRFP